MKKLKRFPIAPYFPEHSEPESNEEEFKEDKFKDILKEVYDKCVQQMLEIPEIKLQLENIFTSSGGFDFELVNTDPKRIIVLIIASDVVRRKFDNFLRSKTHFTSRDAFLTLNYLCQTEFAQNKMLNLLKRDCQLAKILEIFKKKGLSTKSPGYYDVTQKQVLKIAKPHIIEQIRSRVLAEQKGDYSVALNHLLNEIQAICHMIADKPVDLDDFKAQQVSTFLASKKVPHESCTQIGNLFNRRNKSPISHADPIAWAVTREEYEGYRCHVGKCLKHLL